MSLQAKELTLIQKIPERWRRSVILIRHFVSRFAENDLMGFEQERRESQLVLLAALTMVSGVVASMVFFKLLLLHSSVKIAGIWPEKTYFLTYIMALSGIWCVIVRDNLFMDRRDFANLMVLPLKRRTLFAAKFCSTLFYIFLVAAAINLFSTLVITFYVMEKLLISPLYFVLVHLISNFLAILFVFLAIAALQGILMVLLRGRWRRRISALVQGALLMGFISVFVWFPKVYPSLAQLKAGHSPFLYLYPPSWFAGLHEQLSGSVDPLYDRLALLGGLAICLMVFIYGLTLPFGLKRYLRRTDFRESTVSPFRPLRRLTARLKDLFLKEPVERGIFHFFMLTLRRSKKHRFYLALMMALPVGFVVSQAVYLFSRKGLHYFQAVNVPMLYFPFILGFALIGGLRILVELPVNVNAHWLFQVSENVRGQLYFTGLKKALCFAAVLPLFLILLGIYLYFWKPGIALQHSLYCLVTLLLIVEVFFLGYRKVPFAGVYNPEATNLKATWPLFLLIFLIYSFVFINLGLLLLLKPRYNILFYPAALLLHLGLKWYENKNGKPGLVFVEEVPPFMLSLDLGR
jgi:hypothetical protein